MSASAKVRMAVINVLVERNALAAFDALAVARGGRSALVRQLIAQTLCDAGQTARIDPQQGSATVRIALFFTDVERAMIELRAAQRGTNRTGWIKALVRRHLALKSRVEDSLLAELAPIRMQLLRIERNLSQAAKAASTALMPDGDGAIGEQLRRIADMRPEISEQIAAVGAAMCRDASYWMVPD